MLTYIFVYGIIFFSILYDRKHVSNKTKRIVLFMCVVLLSCFMGLRWNVGSDWDQYYTCFKTIRDNEMFHYYRYGEQYFEPLYSFMNWIFKYLFGPDSYSFFLLVTTAVRFSIWAYVSKKLSSTPIITFVCLLSSELTFPTARSAVAFALVCLSLVYIVERNFKKFLVSVLIAGLIHSSSFVFLPMYFIFGKVDMKWYYSFTVFTISIAVSIVVDKYLPDLGAALSLYAGDGGMQEKIENYTSWQTDEGALKSVSSYALTYIWLTIFYFLKRYLDDSEKERYNYYLLLYTINVSMTSMFALYFSDLTRMALFFNTWPMLVPFIFRRYKKLFVPIAFLFILFFYYRLNGMIFQSIYQDYYIPYKSIFSR